MPWQAPRHTGSPTSCSHGGICHQYSASRKTDCPISTELAAPSGRYPQRCHRTTPSETLLGEQEDLLTIYPQPHPWGVDTDDTLVLTRTLPLLEPSDELSRPAQSGESPAQREQDGRSGCSAEAHARSAAAPDSRLGQQREGAPRCDERHIRSDSKHLAGCSTGRRLGELDDRYRLLTCVNSRPRKRD